MREEPRMDEQSVTGNGKKGAGSVPRRSNVGKARKGKDEAAAERLKKLQEQQKEHRKRLKKRFLTHGAKTFRDYELLEFLLTHVRPRVDTKPFAKDLIARFKGLQGVLDAPMADLMKVNGVGEDSAILISLVKEIYVASLAQPMMGQDFLSSPKAVVEFARARLGGNANEAFAVIFLNVKNEVIGYQTVHEGTIDRAMIYPRNVLKAALEHHAAAILLVHNHPSGHTEPSEEDRAVTRTIVQAAEAIDLRVLDHIIVARDGYLSFMEKGLMPG